MSTIMEFIKKNKIVLGVLVFLLISLGIYMFASAEEDIYSDKIKVSNVSVTTLSGTAPFDNSEGAGNDTSETDNIVRSFDSIEYDVTYSLIAKSSDTELNSDAQRTVIMDFIIPESISDSVKVGINNLSNPESVNPDDITISDVKYKNYKFTFDKQSLINANTQKIFIYDISLNNGISISPIIRLRESTDTEQTDDNILTNKTDAKNITVSAKEKYDIKLYAGALKKVSTEESNIPVGVLVYLPVDSTKGIKGIEIPTAVKVNLTATASDTNASIASAKIDVYNQNEYSIPSLPSSYENGTSINGDNGKYEVTFSNLTYKSGLAEIEENVSVPYIASNAVILTGKRNGSQNKITYSINAGTSTINIVDSPDKVVGDYLSKVDFINKSDLSDITSSTANVTDSNSAAYNMGEQFYIQNTIEYGKQTGDNLENGFTNYLKIDNDAIDVISINDSQDYYIDKTENDKYQIEFGVGKWSSEYFKLGSNSKNASYCPKSTSGLSKESLMNYFGGPCIEANENVVWKSSIDEAHAAGDIIAVRLTVNGQYESGKSTIIRVLAKARNDSKLSGNTYQVVARGLTKDSNGSIFYMYKPAVTSQGQSYTIPVNYSNEGELSYNKTEYNSKTKEVVTSDNPSGQYGNSIIVTNAKANIKSIITKDSYGVENKAIYSGHNDPLEIRINPAVYTSNLSSIIKSFSVYVYLPNSLSLYKKSGDKLPNGSSTELDYNIYRYDYDSSALVSNDLSELVLHAYVSIDTVSNTTAKIIVKTAGTVSIDGNTVDINGPTNLSTASKDVMLFNEKEISTLGTADPSLIDINGSYSYNIKAVNVLNDKANLELVYVLPYNNDGVSGGKGSSFSGNLSTKISSTIPSGYSVYYTTIDSKVIINNEVKNSTSNDWKEWTNYTTEKNGVTGVKLVSKDAIATSGYFGGTDGITFNVKTSGNAEANVYYNNFYVFDRNGKICNSTDDQGKCLSSETGTKVYNSNVSSVSVYDRSISGMAFEDSDGNGFSSDDETKLSNIPVELYKTNAKVDNPNDPLSVISSSDEKVAETVTDSDGAYKFNQLLSGNYYVRFSIDCDKYSVTEKNKKDSSLGDMTNLDSDVVMQTDTCYAVSNIVTLDNNNVEVTGLNLGLNVRQVFDISLNKYITNVTVVSNKGTSSYDYDRQNKVKIDVKNLKNTSFKVSYLIEIENSKYFPGTVGNLVEEIPSGMTFNPNYSENEGWYESDGLLYYSGLDSKILMPGEKQYITIILDLVTGNGGDYINFVVANDLRIQQNQIDFFNINNSQTGDNVGDVDNGSDDGYDDGEFEDETNGGE